MNAYSNLPLAFLTATLCLAPVIHAQDAKKPVLPDPAMAKKMLQARNPGPGHEKMAKYVGTSALTITMGSGAKTMVSKGTATSRTMVGGRFFQVEYSAETKFGEIEGAFTIGFDRRHDRFTLSAMDNSGTYRVTSQGKPDEKTGKIKLYGKDDDPMMKSMGFTKEFAHVLDFRGPDEFVIEVCYVDTRTDEREEQKAMEYVFERKK